MQQSAAEHLKQQDHASDCVGKGALVVIIVSECVFSLTRCVLQPIGEHLEIMQATG